MKYKRLLVLAKQCLEENDLGVGHTLRVLETAKKNYDRYSLDESWKDVVFSLIILHDIGGSEVKDQYEKGPVIAKQLLEKLDYNPFDIKLICKFIARHHERLKDPNEIFKILFDSDQLVKFSEEEFDYYNKKEGFNWQSVINSFYHGNLKDSARKLLKQQYSTHLR